LSELWRPEQLVTALRSRDLANFCVDSKPKLGGVVCVLLVDGTTANLNPIRSAGSIRGLIRGNKGTLCAGEVGGCHEKLFEVEADVGIAWRIREFVWAEVVTLIDSPEWQRIEYIDWLGRRQQRPSSGKFNRLLGAGYWLQGSPIVVSVGENVGFYQAVMKPPEFNPEATRPA